MSGGVKYSQVLFGDVWWVVVVSHYLMFHAKSLIFNNVPFWRL